MFELTIINAFEAAHSIRNYPGKCNRLHGHNWKVEVTVKGTKLDKLGMLIDFGDLKSEVTKVLDNLDHYYINEVSPFCEINPTAENLAKYIYDELIKNDIFKTIKLQSIKVWESPNSAVAYMEE